MSTVTLYHYTTEAGARGILNGGSIKHSVQRGTGRNKDDASYGSGVYLTSLSPDNGREKIAINNYDGKRATFRRMLENGKVNFAIEFKLKLDDSKLKEVAKESDRDIWLYNGDLRVDKINQPWVIDVENQEDVYFGTGSQIVPFI